MNNKSVIIRENPFNPCLMGLMFIKSNDKKSPLTSLVQPLVSGLAYFVQIKISGRFYSWHNFDKLFSAINFSIL